MAVLWRLISYVMTSDAPVLFLSAYGVSGRVYCVLESILWYVTFMAMSPMWSLVPPPNVLGTPSHGSFRYQQISDIMEAVVIIHTAPYLHSLDKSLQNAPVNGQDNIVMFQAQDHNQERSRQYLEESITERKHRLRVYLRYSNLDMVERNDARIIVLFALYKLGRLFFTSALVNGDSVWDIKTRRIKRYSISVR